MARKLKRHERYAVHELQRIGRALVDGTWSQSGSNPGELRPMSVADAVITLSRALLVVVRVGLDSVVRELTGE